MTEINLKIKKGDDVTTKPFEIEEIDGQQFQETMLILKKVMSMTEEEPAIKELIDGFVNAGDGEDKDIDAKIIRLALGAFETLLVNVPELAFDLLATLSGIEREVLVKQKMSKQFDIYDAVLEENDIQKLITRAKKSLAATKMKMSWMKVVKTATGSGKAATNPAQA